MATRVTRSEQVGRNRALLLSAARRVFLSRGYANATIDAIAEEAGFSKGVVYSQFAGKADLFLALLEQRIAQREQENLAAAAGPGTHEDLLDLMHRNGRRPKSEAAWARLLIEFRVVAARDEELNRRYSALHARAVDGVAAALEQVSERTGQRLSHPPRQLAEFLMALDNGVTLERAVSPGALPWSLLDDLLSAALDLSSSERRVSSTQEDLR